MKGKVEYVSEKFNHGIKLEGDDKWLNGTEKTKDQISKDLKGKEVEVTLDDKGKVSKVEVLSGPVSASNKSQMSPEQSKLVIRQCCVKAACAAISVPVTELNPGTIELVKGFAAELEQWILRDQK